MTDPNASNQVDCVFTVTDGVARIESVQMAPTSEDNCIDAVKILFSFTPAGLSGPDENLFYQLVVGDGKNPNADWADSKGLVVGAEFGVTLTEDETGNCSALTYEFTDLDLSDYADSCF